MDFGDIDKFDRVIKLFAAQQYNYQQGARKEIRACLAVVMGAVFPELVPELFPKTAGSQMQKVETTAHHLKLARSALKGLLPAENIR